MKNKTLRKRKTISFPYETWEWVEKKRLASTHKSFSRILADLVESKMPVKS